MENTNMPGNNTKKLMEVNKELINELAAIKDEHITLQIQIEEQRREIVKLKSVIKRKNAKIAKYRKL